MSRHGSRASGARRGRSRAGGGARGEAHPSLPPSAEAGARRAACETWLFRKSLPAARCVANAYFRRGALCRNTIARSKILCTPTTSPGNRNNKGIGVRATPASCKMYRGVITVHGPRVDCQSRIVECFVNICGFSNILRDYRRSRDGSSRLTEPITL